MLFKNVIGHSEIKQKLIQTVKENRISHAQLFLGAEGCGKMALALAYAQYITCENRLDDDSCGKCPPCLKYNKLIHPDLHFVYPVVKTPKFSKPVSDDFIGEWRKFILQSAYCSVPGWIDALGAENQQPSIYAHESQEIIRKLNLKTYEADYKIMIIWLPEKMNVQASNKLLKMIEEPPPKTLFLLVSENEEDIIGTIRSRTQLIKIPKINEQDLHSALTQAYPDISESQLKGIVRLADGSYINAVTIIKSYNNESTGKFEPDKLFFELFSNLMRLCYAVNIVELYALLDKLNDLGREKQKMFFDYCIRLLRENFILNIAPETNEKLVYLLDAEAAFSKKFSEFIKPQNIFQLVDEFEKAHYHIERNANDRILLLDLALKIIKLLKIN